MNKKTKRLINWLGIFLTLSLGVFIVLKNLQESIVFFLTPYELINANLKPNQIIRLGGVVETNSIKRNDLETYFTITDTQAKVLVYYHGALPNLFCEGQGIVAKGKLINNQFFAQELLVKHDENYMPREVADLMKKSKDRNP